VAATQPARRLYLLRHAKSSWDEPALADHDRPLAARGRRAGELLAEHVRRARIAPQLVLCSSSARTRETLATLELHGDWRRLDARCARLTEFVTPRALAEPEPRRGR
jgi:phosphohistidine phosphatase SixA